MCWWFIFTRKIQEFDKILTRQYDQAAAECKDIFLKKTRDYGTSWRVLRTISIADQLYIKARRIRTLQETRRPG